MTTTEIVKVREIPSSKQGPSSPDKQYELAEYNRLVNEIDLRVGLVPQFFDRVLTVAEKCIAVSGIFLTLAGLVVSLGPRFMTSVQTVSLLLALLCSVAAVALWCCPVLLAFLAGFVGENDLRTAQINYHLRYEHEALYLPRGWETIRHQIFKAMPWFTRDRAQYHELAPRRGMKLLSMRGLFLTVQSLFLLAGMVCALLGSSQFSLVPLLFSLIISSLLALLFLTAVAFTIMTYFTIEHRRHRKDQNDECGKALDCLKERQS